MGANKYGNITQNELQEVLDDNTGDGITEVIDDGDTLVVKFIESERYYEVDSNGNVSAFEIYEDTTPGELAQDENGNFMIESIEDLVVFSAMVNGGYSDDNVNISSNQFSAETVILMRNLNFKSKLSYNDSTTTIYNGYLGIDDETVTLIEGLTDTTLYQGFIPIGTYVNNTYPISFKGTFDGQNYTIANICENLDIQGGLFGSTSKATIQNLTISGEIISNSEAAGVVGYANTGSIINCTNMVNVISESYAGGIVGKTNSVNNVGITVKECNNEGDIDGDVYVGGILGLGRYDEISNCSNSGNITNEDGSAGGIVGDTDGTTIFNCYNYISSTIIASHSAGGIIGRTAIASYIYIYNCYNLGIINGSTNAGGIIGYVWDSIHCINVFSTGKITGDNVGGIAGTALWNNTDGNVFTNCYYIKSDTVTGSTGSRISADATGLESLDSTVIETLNEYIADDVDEIGTSDWEKWIIDEDGYPTFE